MPRNSHRFFLFSAILLLSVSAFAQRSTPKAAVESFYKFDRSNPQAFNRRNIEARKAWFSPALYALFQNELRRETAYLKKNPTNKPYFGDSLPFRPLEELCDGPQKLGRVLTIKQEFQRSSRGAVTATFEYPKPCTTRDTVVYTIGLIKVNGGWVIDDVNYGEDTNLKERLRREEY